MNILYPHTRKGAVFALLVVFLFTWSQTSSAESISLNQCANGGIKDAVDHLECYDGWINGNLNQSKAAFAEGQFVPYRARLTGLASGQKYIYSFSWDILKSGQHAMDYIGTFNHSVINADPCDGAGGICPGTIDIVAIPPDPTVTAGIGGIQAPGEFTIFGGTFDGVGAYLDISTDVRGISVEFTPDQSSVVLAWGGHISSPFDWGEGETASGIHGSPYHFSNISLRDSTGAIVASGGQDVQLSAAAVFRPSIIRVMKTANKDDTFSFESSLGATPIPPDGETNPWTLATGDFKDISAPADGGVTITESNLPDGPWRLKSIICSEMNAGVVFEYDADSDSLTNEAAFNVGEGESYLCTFDNEFFGAPVLKVIKKVIAYDATCTAAIRDSLDNETLSIHSGEQVKFCYWVTNTGDDPALDISLSDDLGDETGVPAIISLMGGADLDGETDAPDLGVNAWVYGEMVIAINVALGTTVTNIATASGTGEFDGQAYGDTDDANVITDKSSNCTLVASVYTGAGPCAGTPQVDILAGTSVHWCGKATWDGNAVLDLTDIDVELLSPSLLNNSESDMIPGAIRNIEVGSMVANSDLNGTVKLTGSEGGLNPVSCQGPATINVVTPGIKLTKTISLDGVCSVDETNQATIINGEPVWYCLTAENTGDVALTNVLLNDPDINLSNYDGGGLAVSEIKTYPIFGPFYPMSGYTNTATVRATEPMTDSPVGPESSSATLTVLSADISVDKSVDPGNIVICDEGSTVPEEFCSEPNMAGLFDATYTIKTSNHGPNVAEGVDVSDTLPTGFDYLHYEPISLGCDDTNLPEFNCYLGDIEPGASVTITIYGEIDPEAFDFPWTTINNQACANTYPPELDPDHSNNCDDAKTKLGTGATRTIGWWSTHPDGLNACLVASGGEIELGFLTIRTESVDDEIDATVSTDTNAKGKYKSSLMTAQAIGDNDGSASSAIVMAKGMMNANVSHWGDKTQRSHIGQARVKAAKQLTGAWCNETLFGSVFGNFLGGWAEIYLIMAGQAYLDADGIFTPCGGECAKQHLNAVIRSIGLIGKAADMFNNSGDDLDIPFPPGPANPHAEENDPTDPAD